MTIDGKIRDKILQYDIKREAQTYHHGKIDKYEYLTGEEIIPSDKEEQ